MLKYFGFVVSFVGGVFLGNGAILIGVLLAIVGASLITKGVLNDEKYKYNR